VDIEWRAYDLHPGIPPEGQPIPWPPEVRAQRGQNFKRLADQAGLPYGDRSHWYDSEPAHEASEWASEQGAGEKFRHAIYDAYFVKNINIGSPDVLAKIANDLGLDGDDLREALKEERYRERVTEQFQEAHQVGVTGVPTFVAGGYAVVGAQPYEMFIRLMETVGAQRRAEAS
jgi:predicted DsbA family dithiol-disulfide isomerase